MRKQFYSACWHSRTKKRIHMTEAIWRGNLKLKVKHYSVTFHAVAVASFAGKSPQSILHLNLFHNKLVSRNECNFKSYGNKREKTNE
jgi:hypothetical protein